MPRDLIGMNDSLKRYQTSLRDVEKRRNHLKSGDQKWNLLRVGLFILFLVTLGLSYTEGLDWLLPVPWLVLLVFLVAVTLHQRLRDEIEDLRNSRSVLRRLIARCERNWDRLPVWKPSDELLNDAPERASTPGSISNDLDVFGKGSLFQLVSMASTGPGLRTLANWIVGPAIAKQATERAAAAESLASMHDLRERLYKLARRAASGTADPDHFLNWIKQPSWLSRHQALSIWSFVAPVAIIALFICQFLLNDPQSLQITRIALVALVGINAAISTFMLGDVHQIFASAIAGRGDVDGYQHLFGIASELSSTSPILTNIKERLATSPHNAADAMASLNWIATATSIKQVALLFPIYLILQMVGLWEVHVLRKLEQWQDRNRDYASGWFDALGELEAVGSIAALADECPTWARPQWIGVNEDAALEATQMGHPLLKDGVRVCNDVKIGPSGTLLLVTGSNMSGKSTMLRSVGLNVLLAGSGAPVCAATMKLPSIELATSIRVRDNLDEGVSFYMAELQSLARVVQHAELIATSAAANTAGSVEPTKLLFLLDEILQGTNSRERQIAVSHVLRHLIKCKAIGAITTHDLELADDPQLKAMAHTVHFRETITQASDGSDTMTFDYKMRQGVSPTTNALRLLELVGLGKAGD